MRIKSYFTRLLSQRKPIVCVYHVALEMRVLNIGIRSRTHFALIELKKPQPNYNHK